MQDPKLIEVCYWKVPQETWVCLSCGNEHSVETKQCANHFMRPRHWLRKGHTLQDVTNVDEALHLLRQLYDRTKDVNDRSANDGDGRIDEWQSNEFGDLLKRIKTHLDIR